MPIWYLLSCYAGAYLFGIFCVVYVGDHRSTPIAVLFGAILPVFIIFSFIGSFWFLDIFHKAEDKGVAISAVVTLILSIAAVKMVNAKYSRKT